MRTFTIVTGGRTGSTFLVRTLNRHSSIYCIGEFFHPGNKNLPSHRFEKPTESLYGYYQQQGKQICGCKIISGRDNKFVGEVIEKSEVNIILKRRNKLQQVVSSYVASMVNDWEDYSKKVHEPFIVPIDFIKRFYGGYLERDKDMEGLPNQFELYYEDFSLDKFNEMFQRLGVSFVSSIDFEEGPQRKKVYSLIVNKKELEDMFGYSLED